MMATNTCFKEWRALKSVLSICKYHIDKWANSYDTGAAFDFTIVVVTFHKCL